MIAEHNVIFESLIAKAKKGMAPYPQYLHHFDEGWGLAIAVNDLWWGSGTILKGTIVLARVYDTNLYQKTSYVWAFYDQMVEGLHPWSKSDDASEAATRWTDLKFLPI